MAAEFHNYGQCVREWVHHKSRPGDSYGGNTTVNASIDLDIKNSNNNVINVSINIFR